jgi:hypothetical protein
MYEYLKQMEYPPERGDDGKILESNCKIGRVNLKIMGYSAHTTHHTNQNQKSAPALFLKYENIFQKPG